MFSKEKNKGVKASQAEDYKLRKEGITALQNSDSCFWSKSHVIIGLTLFSLMLLLFRLLNLSVKPDTE